MFFSHLVFSLTVIDSQEILHWALSLVGIQSTGAILWVVTKFLYPSFRVCLSDVSWRSVRLVLYSY